VKHYGVMTFVSLSHKKIAEYQLVNKIHVITAIALFFACRSQEIYYINSMANGIKILLVEDDDLDAYIAEHMLRNANKSCDIQRSPNGVKAIEYLLDETSVPPSAIILDLNMPLMNGIEFLEAVRREKKLKDLTITVLTSSMNPNDQKFCEEYGVKKYYTKPLDEVTSKEIINLASLA